MRIGEVARTLGTDTPTIRYYEEVGVLPDPERSENRYREYRDEDVRRIQLVLALRRLDVPLEEIRALAGTCFDHRCATSTQELLEVIDRRSGQVHRQIEELRSLADRFADLRRRLANEGGSRMAIDTKREDTAPRAQATESANCDCGCLGPGCNCGCSCCGVVAEHAGHQNAVEVLALTPQTACDCGCCG